MRTMGEITEKIHQLEKEHMPLWLVGTEVEGSEKIHYQITGKNIDESHIDYHMHVYNGVLV